MKKPAAGIVLVVVCWLAQSAHACSPMTDVEGLPATQTAVASSVYATLTAEAPAIEVAQTRPTETPGPAVEAISPTPPPAAQAEATPQPGQVRGRVFDHDTGQPVEGAQVILGKDVTASDAHGEFAFDQVPSGPQALVATRDGYETASTSVFSVNAGELKDITLRMYPVGTFAIPEDPMATNQVEPVGAQTEEDAIRLAQLQGLSTPIESVEPRHLTGDYLVNYKKDDNVYTARATLSHEGWALVSQGREWYVVQTCGNLAVPIPEYSPVLYVAFEPAVVPTPTPAATPTPTSNPTATAVPSPNRRSLIAFDTYGISIYVMRPDGTNKQLVVTNRDQEISERETMAWPAWSPDGKRMAYTCGIGSPHWQICVMEADGGNRVQLTSGDGLSRDPTWSPKGDLIAFDSSNVSGAWNIYLIGPDSSGLTQLTFSTDGDPGWPSWAPDGEHITFSGLIGTASSGIYTIRVDGTQLAQLTHSDGDVMPDWSPDGKRIAFSCRGNLCLVDSNGTNRVQLTHRPSSDPRYLQVSYPSWSPNGTQIAFCALGHYGEDLTSSYWDIFVIDADGSNMTNITNTPDVGEYAPNWSPWLD